MPDIKILHTADIHIGANESFLGVKAAARRAETLFTFEKIIDTAKENDVKIILIAGDLLNSNKIEHSFIERITDKIRDAKDIRIVFSAGNHDPLTAESPFLKLRYPNNFHILKPHDDCIEFKDLSVRVYGRSFAEVYEKGEESFSLTPPDDDFINLMCIHGELSSNLESDYNAVTDGFIRNSGMDYIALGHVHKRTDIGKLGNTYFSYCGCPEGQGFDESGEKGVYMGTVSKKGVALQFIPLGKRMHLLENVEISGLSSSAEIAEKILSAVFQKYGETASENLYKISLCGEVGEDCEINIPEILSRVTDKVYFAKIKDKTAPLVNIKRLKCENSLRGLFVRNMLNRIENTSDEEKENLNAALRLGLKAFKSEVNYNEDQ